MSDVVQFFHTKKEGIPSSYFGLKNIFMHQKVDPFPNLNFVLKSRCRANKQGQVYFIVFTTRPSPKVPKVKVYHRQTDRQTNRQIL